MNLPARPSVRLALFGAALAAAVGLGAVTGAAVGPIDTGDDEPATTATTQTTVEHGSHQ